MTHCEKCIHYDMCKAEHDSLDGTVLSFFPNNEDCNFFKNKFDFVEVVRCKDCKHYEDKGFLVEVDKNFGNCKQPILFWDDEPKEVWETDYCSYGERK